MNRIKKIAAALTVFSLAASAASCSSPAIGAGTSTAVTIDDYKVNAGIFIYYTMQSFSDAQSLIAEDSADSSVTPTVDEVEDATIDGLDATEWIQNKATQYCSDFVAIEREFDKIGEQLTDEELDEIEQIVESTTANEIFNENGIGEESIRAIASSTYKSDHIFEYYYGIDRDKGMSEDELKEYFDNNFARVKYVTMSYLDADGNKLDESGKKEIRDMAAEYAERVNAKSDNMDKLYEMNEVSTDYSEYVEEKSAEQEEEDSTGTTTTTTSTTTSAETTTTTTTNPYANEKLIQKATTTTADVSEDAATTTTTSTPTASEKSSKKLNDFIFEELTEYNKAVVFDDEENDSIYVVIRADLNERLTDDDLWTEDNIKYLESLNFNQEYLDYMKEISDSYTADKNKKAYKRYKPFKLTLEED